MNRQYEQGEVGGWTQRASSCARYRPGARYTYRVRARAGPRGGRPRRPDFDTVWQKQGQSRHSSDEMINLFQKICSFAPAAGRDSESQRNSAEMPRHVRGARTAAQTPSGAPETSLPPLPARQRWKAAARACTSVRRAAISLVRRIRGASRRRPRVAGQRMCGGAGIIQIAGGGGERQPSFLVQDDA